MPESTLTLPSRRSLSSGVSGPEEFIGNALCALGMMGTQESGLEPGLRTQKTRQQR